MHNVLVTSGLELVPQFRLVGVTMHRIAYKQEVELFSELTLDKLLKFMANFILSHANDNNDFALFIFGIQGLYELNELVLVDFGADLNANRV